ncbi:MAG TPA: hypothetical protein VGD58_29295, partial [Herpetosiphonaceae bacterium]
MGIDDHHGVQCAKTDCAINKSYCSAMSKHSSHPSMIITLPLPLLIDLVNHIYIFSNVADMIDGELAAQFKIARKTQDSGPWWKIFYSLGFHSAIRHITERTNNRLLQ